MSEHNIYLCPYCGFYDESISIFRLKIKDGYSKVRVICPNCQSIMKSEIIKNKLNIDELGEWLYLSFAHYTKDEYGFISGLFREREYSKIKFEKLLQNLYDLKPFYAKQFWFGWDKGKELDRDKRLERYVELKNKMFQHLKQKVLI